MHVVRHLPGCGRQSNAGAVTDESKYDVSHESRH